MFDENTMQKKHCCDIECAPPFGDKADCEFNHDGFCTAKPLGESLTALSNSQNSVKPIKHNHSHQKYSLIARDYLKELDELEPVVEHTMITWGNCQMMEDLFDRFGGDRELIRRRTGCIGHHYRFKFVMDKLDRESRKPDAIFEKSYIHYNGIINRPTRCFTLKKENDDGSFNQKDRI